jgi:hypothetical protein
LTGLQIAAFVSILEPSGFLLPLFMELKGRQSTTCSTGEEKESKRTVNLNASSDGCVVLSDQILSTILDARLPDSIVLVQYKMLWQPSLGTHFLQCCT